MKLRSRTITAPQPPSPTPADSVEEASGVANGLDDVERALSGLQLNSLTARAMETKLPVTITVSRVNDGTKLIIEDNLDFHWGSTDLCEAWQVEELALCQLYEAIKATYFTNTTYGTIWAKNILLLTVSRRQGIVQVLKNLSKAATGERPFASVLGFIGSTSKLAL